MRCSLKNVRFGVFPVPPDQQSYCVLHAVMDCKDLLKFMIAVTVLKVVHLYRITLLQRKISKGQVRKVP